MPDALVKEDRLWTYRDYREWDLEEGERYEIIYGVAYAMSAPNDKHQAILAALTAKFYTFLEGKPCKVRPAPYDVRLFYEEDESDDTVVQSDLTVICDDAKASGRSRYRRCTVPSPFSKKMLFYSGTLNQKYVSCHIYRRGGKGWQK
jgi:hypothetical protein